MQNNLDIKTTMIDKYKFVIEIASGELEYDRILDWIEIESLKISQPLTGYDDTISPSTEKEKEYGMNIGNRQLTINN